MKKGRTLEDPAPSTSTIYHLPTTFCPKDSRPRHVLSPLAAEQPRCQRLETAPQYRPRIALAAHGRLQLAAQPPLHLVEVRKRKRFDSQRGLVVHASGGGRRGNRCPRGG